MLLSDQFYFTMKQIETAFRWNKPAIISSHRVNFCGHIDPKNREKGLDSLKQLLQEIVKKWPDVEFMAADELASCVKNEKRSVCGSLNHKVRFFRIRPPTSRVFEKFWQK